MISIRDAYLRMMEERYHKCNGTREAFMKSLWRDEFASYDEKTNTMTGIKLLESTLIQAGERWCIKIILDLICEKYPDAKFSDALGLRPVFRHVHRDDLESGAPEFIENLRLETTRDYRKFQKYSFDYVIDGIAPEKIVARTESEATLASTFKNLSINQPTKK